MAFFGLTYITYLNTAITTVSNFCIKFLYNDHKFYHRENHDRISFTFNPLYNLKRPFCPTLVKLNLHPTSYKSADKTVDYDVGYTS